MAKGDAKEYHGPHGLTLMRAASWSVASTAPAGRGTTRQPGLFYQSEEVDRAIDAMIARQAFELRRAQALEAFYLKEIGRDHDTGGSSIFEGPFLKQRGFDAVPGLILGVDKPEDLS